MQSTVRNAIDLETAVARFQWDIQPDQEKIEEALYQIALQYSSYVPQQQTQAGDIVTAQLRSDRKRYDRTLKLNLGGGMFDKALEQDMVGREVGADYTYRDAEGTVQYRILDAQRLIVPALTDEMVRQQEMDGIGTVQQLRNHYFKTTSHDQVMEQVTPFLEEYLAACEFEIAESDLDILDELELERCRAIAKEMDLVFDEMQGDAMLGATGCQDIEAFKTMIHGAHREDLQLALLADRFADTPFTQVTKEQLNNCVRAFLEKITEYVLKTV